MKQISLALVLGVGLIASTTSLLAGPGTDVSKNQTAAPLAAEPFDWSGLYGGLNVGAVFTHHDVDLDLPLSHPESTGVIGGGQLGLNLEWGVFVVGVEGDF